MLKICSTSHRLTAVFASTLAIFFPMMLVFLLFYVLSWLSAAVESNAEVYKIATDKTKIIEPLDALSNQDLKVPSNGNRIEVLAVEGIASQTTIRSAFAVASSDVLLSQKDLQTITENDLQKRFGKSLRIGEIEHAICLCNLEKSTSYILVLSWPATHPVSISATMNVWSADQLALPRTCDRSMIASLVRVTIGSHYASHDPSLLISPLPVPIAITAHRLLWGLIPRAVIPTGLLIAANAAVCILFVNPMIHHILSRIGIDIKHKKEC